MSNPIPYTPIGTPKVSKVPFDGANFEVTEWEHAGEYKGKVIYVHGFAESAPIYTEFFDKVSQNGYDVFFFDQRGAGETSKGNDYGVTDSVHVFKDLDFFIKKNIDAGAPGEKFILMGHSMGAGIVLNYGIIGTYRDHIRAIVASAPMVSLHPKTEPNVILRSLSPVLNKLLPNVKMDSKLVVDYVTTNEKWKTYIRKSDTKFIGTIRLFSDMFARGEFLQKSENVAKFSPDISVLVAHGDVDYINNLEGLKKFFKLLPDTVTKKFIEVKGSRHSIFLEVDDIFNPVFDQILEFLEKS